MCLWRRRDRRNGDPYEEREGYLLASKHFPDGGEPLIETEEDAWKLAAGFAKVDPYRYVNIYVVDEHWSPVPEYKERLLNRYPAR